MSRNRPAADASTHQPEPAMQFFASSQQPWSNTKPAMFVPARAKSPAGVKPEVCGWYDSTFELSQGLEVTEHDNDTLYQLWELSQS
jgi:hypothetical protein